jgi:anti-anti-sigma regulatory factor
VPNLPSSAVTVTWADGTAIVAVCGELDPLTCSRVRERIASVIGTGPQWLTLNLVDVGDRFSAECLALIAIARHLLPPGCQLDVCSASPIVRRILALADWDGA